MQTIREVLKSLENSTSLDVLEPFIDKGLSEEELRSLKKLGFVVYEGKVRSVIRGRDQSLRVHHTDRLTAFDRLIGYVPFKGRILTDISEWWFIELGQKYPHHFLRRIDQRTLLVEAMKPIKAEVVVRGYLAGSMLRAYEKGVRDFCGNILPEGLLPYSKLPKPILTPTTKAAAFEHDEDASAEILIQRNVCTKEQWQRIQEIALGMFDWGSKKLEAKGWILVDTKYEFGLSESGEIKVIDEIHTPDSSRFWVASSYAERLKQNAQPEMLDKENVRKYLLAQGFQGYGDVPNVPVSELIKLARIYLDVAEGLCGRAIPL